jgi:S-adenosylmethionine:tRNA ribosyltransferase-isomerase
MKTSDFDYPLPESSIAQSPLRQRDLCRLCVIDRATGAVEHKRFKDLGDFLNPGDLLVLNDTRVLRCRIPCVKEASGGAMEIFLLDPPQPARPDARAFRAFFKPARRAKVGSLLRPSRHPEAGCFKVLAQNGEEGGSVEWLGQNGQALDAALLENLGVVPLPPYIKRERFPSAELTRLDARYYQSVFAKAGGSAAAPTASLHFSRALLARLQKRGIDMARVTLHVGAGTFLPVKTEILEAHPMHSEPFILPDETVKKILETKRRHGRVIAVGTTVVRVLETAFDKNLVPVLTHGDTRLFLKPGATFNVVDALVTNFHQPKSTLLALVSAFYTTEKLLNIYAECLKQRYRFLSYGDAMFIHGNKAF